MTNKAKRILLAAAAIAALALGGAAIAGATGGGDDEKPIAGDDLQRASRVALDRTGGGQVTATELGDEEGYYEVEVRRDDGSTVDVHLDRNFNVIDASPDGEGDEPDADGR
jgi:hypothetical protein